MTNENQSLYREEKAVAVAAKFLELSNGKCDKYWLNKVLYYVERQSLILSGQPVFFDDLYSAPYGPITSKANDGIDIAAYPVKSPWATHFKLEGNSLLLLKSPDYTVLSDFEIDLITTTYKKFHGLNFNAMHKFFRNLPEHTETNSHVPIDYTAILSAEGFPKSTIDETIEELNYLQFMEGTLTCDSR